MTPISLNDVPNRPRPVPEELDAPKPDPIEEIQATTVDPSLAVNAALLVEGGTE